MMSMNLLAVLAIAALLNGAQAQCSVSLPRSLIVAIELTLPPQFTDSSRTECCTVSDTPPKRANRR